MSEDKKSASHVAQKRRRRFAAACAEAAAASWHWHDWGCGTSPKADSNDGMRVVGQVLHFRFSNRLDGVLA